MYIGIPFLLVVLVAYVLYRMYRKPIAPVPIPPKCDCFERRATLEYEDCVQEFCELKEREHRVREYLYENWPDEFEKYKNRIDDYLGAPIDVKWIVSFR
jgi:hypothetical protein